MKQKARILQTFVAAGTALFLGLTAANTARAGNALEDAARKAGVMPSAQEIKKARSQQEALCGDMAPQYGLPRGSSCTKVEKAAQEMLRRSYNQENNLSPDTSFDKASRAALKSQQRRQRLLQKTP